MSNEEELSRIETKIRELVELALKDGVPYLLSALGAHMESDLVKLKLLSKKSLADFVVDRFGNEYAIVTGGVHGNVKALVRTANQTGEVVLPVGGGKPRFHRRFWAAFAAPIPEGKIRLLNLADLSFDHVESSEKMEVPRGTIEISTSLVPSEDAVDRDHMIIENIKKWVEEYDLDISQFILGAPGYPDRRPNNREQTHTLLSQFILALDKRQLSSVSLPLDVVAALLSKRI